MEVKKFEQLDGLRFFAVFLVVCVHWSWSGQQFMNKFNSGSRGVDLFFVISGFLITLGLIKSKGKAQTTGNSLYKFYARRFLRIFPVYYLFLFVLYFFDRAKVEGDMRWYLLYLSNFHSIKTQSWGGLGHLWSLAVEEQFYLVWPFIILFTPRKYLVWVISSAIALSVAAKIVWRMQGDEFWSPYMHPLGPLDTLAIGALLSYFYYFYEDKLRAALYNPYITAAVFLEVSLFLYSQFTPFNFLYHVGGRTFYGIFCAWLIGRAVFSFGGLMGAILSYKPIRYIGTISYAVYLFHPLVPDLVWHFIELPLTDNAKFIIHGAATIALASLSWYAFESQILKLKSRFE